MKNVRRVRFEADGGAVQVHPVHISVRGRASHQHQDCCAEETQRHGEGVRQDRVN